VQSADNLNGRAGKHSLHPVREHWVVAAGIRARRVPSSSLPVRYCEDTTGKPPAVPASRAWSGANQQPTQL